MTQTVTPPPASTPTSQNPPLPFKNAMPFIEHLAELRRRLIFCFVSVIVTTTLAFIYANPMINALKTLAPHTTIFVQLTPGEVFLASFKLSMMTGLGLSLPVIMYHVLRFVSPGLESKEKRYVLPLLALGLLLFVGGVAFGFAVILPLMLTFLLDYGQEVAQNQLSIASFLDFCTGFLFASGLVFQIPLFLLLTSLLGFSNSTQLLQQWKWAIIISFLAGAIITPSADPFSQAVMAASLFGLYGVSIALIKAFGR